jgi:hypothetical protein
MLQRLTVQTHRQSEFIDITPQVQQAVRDSGIGDGVVYVYCPHTTCGLTIQEHADPGVQHDMLLLNRLAPLPRVDERRLADAAGSGFTPRREVLPAQQRPALGRRCIRGGRRVKSERSARFIKKHRPCYNVSSGIRRQTEG